MIDRGHGLPPARQAALLTLSRSSLYYEPRAVPAADLAIMRRIDALHLDYGGGRIGSGGCWGDGGRVHRGRSRVAVRGG